MLKSPMRSERPLILISLSEEKMEPRYSLRSAYARAIQNAGGLAAAACPAPDAESVEALLARVDGLLLSGGDDIHPLLCGEEPRAGIGPVFPERDRWELSLASAALRRDLPVLGICRGAQILNIAAGGSLYQDLAFFRRANPILHRQTAERPQPWHSLHVKPGSRLRGWLGLQGTDGTLPVNSIHHQAVKRPARGWKACAHAPDGVIEAIECPGKSFALGVQWHPEELPEQAALFSAFVEAARRATGKT